jgi:hypothetical protein
VKSRADCIEKEMRPEHLESWPLLERRA